MDNQQGNLELERYIRSVAYSIGALLGDGSISTSPTLSRERKLVTNYIVQISNMDRECIDRVCSEISRVTDVRGTVHEYTNVNGTTMYRYAANNKVVYTFFYYFIREKMFVADEIFKADKQIRLNFLAGLFDTDGCISCSNGYYRISYAARLKTLVEDVARLMQKLGVKVGKVHEQVSGFGTTMYVIKPNIRSFIDAGCYFYIKRKADRLYEYLKSVGA